MDIQQCDILCALAAEPFASQRLLAERCGHSLGVVNRSVRTLAAEGYLDGDMMITAKARELFAAQRPRRAVILAAGAGMRMVPINMEAPKGLLEVHGEALIERLIRQLQEADVREIYVVVGFMKEQYEYLIDRYGVTLLVNRDFARKNNLHSLRLALDRLDNAYIVPCDLWCADNPFRSRELYSWYLVTDEERPGSSFRVNRKRELVADASAPGCALMGIAYLLPEQADTLRARVRAMAADVRFNGAWWEDALMDKDRFLLPARIMGADRVIEINTYEQLRELDSGSGQLRSDAIAAAADALGARPRDLERITSLKKGMTNRSFLFTCRGRRYVMRIPGEGTDRLIDRQQEAAVYGAIRGRGLCDDPIYLDPSTGYKLTAFLEGTRVCDPEDPEDLGRCMELLRRFHDMDLTVPHSFDIFGQIEFYESLWNGAPSVYRDYERTKADVLSLQGYIDAHVQRRCLTHIDAVPDNFLFVSRPDGGADVQLIDWEYAGMQDPHVDIAMFCIYALYDRARCDRLIDLYFPEGCPAPTRRKIYCYIAACGLLWSNWCEYKRSLGVDFGEYALRQYRYAKDFYRLVRDELEDGTCTQ